MATNWSIFKALRSQKIALLVLDVFDSVGPKIVYTKYFGVTPLWMMLNIFVGLM